MRSHTSTKSSSLKQTCSGNKDNFTEELKSEKLVSNIVELEIAEEQTDDAETKTAGSLAGFELKTPI